MDAKTIQDRLAAYAVERGWDEFDSPKSLAMAMAGETGTLLAIFQWLSGEQSREVARGERQDAVADALADVVLYALRLADKADIDLEQALHARLAARYPITPTEVPQAIAVAAPEPAPESAPAPAPSPPEETLDATADAAQPAAAWPVQGEDDDRARAEPDAEDGGEDETFIFDLGEKGDDTASPFAPPPATVLVSTPTLSASSSPSPPAARVPPPVAPEPSRSCEPSLQPASEPAVDSETVLDFARSLVRALDRANRDDPILRDLRDEVETLRRVVYSPSSKPAWVAGSLRSLYALLEEALRHGFAEEMRLQELASRLARMLPR